MAGVLNVHCGNIFARECIGGVGNEQACLRDKG